MQVTTRFDLGDIVYPLREHAGLWLEIGACRIQEISIGATSLKRRGSRAASTVYRAVFLTPSGRPTRKRWKVYYVAESDVFPTAADAKAAWALRNITSVLVTQ